MFITEAGQRAECRANPRGPPRRQAWDSVKEIILV
jgi:hypothetical protein